MKRFPLEKQFRQSLKMAGIPCQELLRKADLRKNLLDDEDPVVTADEYYRFMQAIGEFQVPEEMILKLTTQEQMEMFSPPVFAAFCSEDGICFLHRMADYEALFCAVEFHITEEEHIVTLELRSGHPNLKVPKILVIIKFLYLLSLLRKATGKEIIPVEIKSTYDIDHAAYQSYFKTLFSKGDTNCLVFTKSDLLLPFLKANESMWTYFEPELKRRLQETEVDESFSAEVRSVLADQLASCNYGGRSSGSKTWCLYKNIAEKASDGGYQLSTTA